MSPFMYGPPRPVLPDLTLGVGFNGARSSIGLPIISPSRLLGPVFGLFISKAANCAPFSPIVVPDMGGGLSARGKSGCGGGMVLLTARCCAMFS